MLISKSLEFLNTKLVYYDSCEGEKVIFVAHANGYSGSCYLYLSRALGFNYRWIFIDFVGHGLSGSNLNFENWNFFRDQILSIIEKENLSKVYGVGHSLGGASLSLAAKSRPELFNSLLLLDPTILNSSLLILGKIVGNPMAETAIKRRRNFSSREQVRKIFKRFPMFVNWRNDIFEDYISSCFQDNEEGVSLSCSPEMEARVFSSVPILFPFKYRGLRVKSIVVIPRKSNVCSLRAAKKLIGNTEYSKVKVLDDATHFFPFENPDCVIDELRVILDG